MAKGEILASSKYYFEIDQLSDLVVKKVSGISIRLQTSEYKNGTITVEFTTTVEDRRLRDWFVDSHSNSKGRETKRNGSITLYNQTAEEAARWDLKGLKPKSYRAFQLSEEGLTIENVEFSIDSILRVK